MQCKNNQKQVVQAMHNYHDTQQSFPWGTRGNAFGTWTIQIFSFIEKNQIIEQYNWNIGTTVGTNAALLSNLVIPLYTCPSDSNQNQCSVSPLLREHNYVVCMGRAGVFNFVGYRDVPLTQKCLIEDADDATGYAKEPSSHGIFIGSCFPKPSGTTIPDYPYSTTFADITDGTSNTVALSETIQGISPNAAPNDIRGLLAWGQTCYFTTNKPLNTTVADIIRGYSLTGHDRHPLAAMDTSTTDAGGQCLRMSARSWHVGGVNAGLADGSIRFITNQINLDIWQAAGSANGSEIELLH
jgi:hypothetical protein